MYDTCRSGCKYCYASHSAATLQRNLQTHDPASPLLCGTITPKDTVRDRKMESCKVEQMGLYDLIKTGGNAMIFRSAIPGDLPQISRLYRAAIGTPGCTWNENYPGTFELEHDFASGNLYVLSEGETVAGAVSVVSPNELDNVYAWEVQNAREIARVVISQDYAGRGLAVQMLSQLFEKLRQEGCNAIHLSVACCNAAAIKTYRRLGFAFLAQADLYGNRYYLCEKKL